MRRPGPLQEWPLEKFLPRDPNIPNPTPLKKNNKRPLSPTTPSHYSPAKRRILNDEGVFSPEKTFKSPLSSLRGGLASPARFSHVLAGSASPARILDFGLPNPHGGDPRKPQRNLSSHTTSFAAPLPSGEPLAPSPELKLRSATHPTTAVRVDQPLFNNNSHHLFSQLALGAKDVGITTLARELPPAPDPQSIHYPGFPVYLDPHLYLYSYQPLGNSLDEPEADRDAVKENLPLRRKVRKSVSAPEADTKAYCDVGTLKRSKSTIHSPKSIPKRDGFALSPEPTTDSNRSSKRSRSELRQIMENELDVDEEADDIYD